MQPGAWRRPPDEIDMFQQVYRRLAIAYGDAKDAGHHREAYDLRHRLIRLRYGKLPVVPTQLAFADLLSDPHPWVRYWAAAGVETTVARDILNELAQLPGRVANHSRSELKTLASRHADLVGHPSERAVPQQAPVIRADSPIARLSARELQVLRLWCRSGGDVLAVARQLGLHESIIEKHLNAACDQFRVESLPELRDCACSPGG